MPHSHELTNLDSGKLAWGPVLLYTPDLGSAIARRVKVSAAGPRELFAMSAFIQQMVEALADDRHVFDSIQSAPVYRSFPSKDELLPDLV